MNLHEYQAKEILIKYNLPIPKFAACRNKEEVEEAIEKLKLKQAVLKVQVHAGGRGKAGGVKFAKTPTEIREAAQQLLGMRIINQQTGSQGLVAECILISEPITIIKEYYLSFLIDRKLAQPVIIASQEGGMDIEEVACKSPEKILTLPIGVDGKLKNFQIFNLINFFHWKGSVAEQGRQLLQQLALAFCQLDASLLEINPLVLADEKLYVLDVKLAIDDNALFRHPELAKQFDITQLTVGERLARQYDLAYIALDGNIGCMVNGAGLAMATMDIIQYYGGKPANFLDVGGGATKEKVAQGFKIILKDPQVKAIFVNIFGGIMDCALLAEGIVSATLEEKIHVPLIVRLEGTNVDKGKNILKNSGLPFITANTMEEGAIKAVEYGNIS